MPKTKTDKTLSTTKTEARKRRREWLIVVVIVGLVALSLRYQGQLFNLTTEIPLSGNILVLALINLNILLIIFCLFLVLRNIFKLVLERRRGIPGAKLRSKLVLAFVALSLIPTMLLFFVSAGFITNSIENWFNSQIEDSLQESLEVAQTYYKNSASNALYYAEQISLAIKEQKLLNEDNLPVLEELIHQFQQDLILL
jgi:two-component system nitrogen regulation sensor histidine kinase NtrY